MEGRTGMKTGLAAAPIALALALALGGCSKEEAANIEATSNEASFINDGALLNDGEAANLVDDETIANTGGVDDAALGNDLDGNATAAGNAL